MKKKNVIWMSKFLIENVPGDTDPFSVWDLRLIFRSDMSEFKCRTLTEAKEMCSAIDYLEEQHKLHLSAVDK